MTILDHPEIRKTAFYWAKRYGSSNPAVFNEILGEAYLAITETLNKYAYLPMSELVILMKHAISWKVKGYFSHNNRAGRNMVMPYQFIDTVQQINDIETLIDIKIRIERLDMRKQYIVRRMVEGYTLTEIGKEIGVSKQRVYQIVKSIAVHKDMI